MNNKKICFRTDSLTEINLKTESDKMNLSLSAYLNFIIRDYATLLSKINGADKRNIKDEKLSELKILIEENNKNFNSFMELERRRMAEKINGLNKEISEVTDKHNNTRNIAAKTSEKIEMFRAILGICVSRYRINYEEVIKDYFKNISMTSMEELQKRKEFMEAEIKPLFPEKKKGIF